MEMNNNQNKDFFRYEKKFLIINKLFDSPYVLKDFLKLDVTQEYEDRQVNSIYYDTENFDIARQKINGQLNSYKLRIRFYGQEQNLKCPVLEFKNKSGNVGSKIKIKLNKDKLIKNNFSLFYLINNNLLPKEIATNLFNFKPKLLVSYRRSYFKSVSSKCRFTFDKDIKFKKLFFPFFNPSLTDNYFQFKDNILEIKYDVFNEIFARNSIKRNPFRYTSCSKYLFGLQESGQLNITI